MKSIIFYTDNHLERSRHQDVPVLVRKFLIDSGLPIFSCSLAPIDFGQNTVLEGHKRGYPTMLLQIITALEASTTKYVFFAEHDCLYHKSHFDFTPPKDDTYYYNVNNYRWIFPKDCLVSHDGQKSLSGLCVNRETALKHFKFRLDYLVKRELFKESDRSKEPRWARRFGYEPGTKKRRKGGITDEDFELWRSELPNIDIRHYRNFSSPPILCIDYRDIPENWKVKRIDEIEGWNLKEMFKL